MTDEKDIWAPLPWSGSFQNGRVFHSGEPLATVWRHVERFGTIESMTRVATKWSDPSKANVASLRVRQAVELRRSSRDASVLTRPLMLYYAMLNLTRSVMATPSGEFGSPTHGLSYVAGSSLLDCAAKTNSKGTFVQFVSSLGYKDDLAKHRLTLRDLLAQIPELRRDFPLFGRGDAAVATVRVKAFMKGDMLMSFSVPGVSEDDFRRDWETFFPWMKDVCELRSKAFTLRVKDPPRTYEAISAFCESKLLSDLRLRNDAVWFDHVARDGVVLLPRPAPYLAAMFILSNVSRYEPELLAEPTRELTDVGYALTTFLDNAERFFPQLILDRLYGTRVFFE